MSEKAKWRTLFLGRAKIGHLEAPGARAMGIRPKPNAAWILSDQNPPQKKSAIFWTTFLFK